MPRFDPKIYERDIYEDSVYFSWLKLSNERDVLEGFLRAHLSLWCKKDPLSILEMGCGSGSDARRVFRILDELGVAYSYTGVDPYQDQLNRWAEWLPEGKDVTLIRGTAESFVPEQKFDLVLVVHALYYVNDLREMLAKVGAWGDTKFIVHHGRYGINEVQEVFRPLVKEGPNIISTYGDVGKALDAHGYGYDLHVVETEVDIRPCHDMANRDGTNLIKFFLEHSELPEKTLAEVSEFLKSKGDFMKQDVGYFFVK